MDLLELEEINFPNRKPVRVRKTTGEKVSVRNQMVNKSTKVTPRSSTYKAEYTQEEEAQLGIKYVLDKGEPQEDLTHAFGQHFAPTKNPSKLPVSFLKMKM